MSTTSSYRPLITSLAFNDSMSYLPLKYNYSINEIIEVKKYLPKNLFKLAGIDAESQKLQIDKETEQKLQKAKLKIKSFQGIQIDSKQKITFVPKQEVKVIEWYNKYIDLRIPYNSKDAPVKLQASIFQHISFYLDNCVFFKNTLTEELYRNDHSLENNNKSLKLTAQQVATETDIVFTCWNIEPQPSDNTVQAISLNLPISLCLQLKQTYTISDLKAILKADISNSISIMIKHNFNTRVLVIGQAQKQFICLNSFCNEDNALKEQQKIRTIIRQNLKQKSIVETQQSRIQQKRNNKFLVAVLGFLVLIYLFLKVSPIHGRNQNQYLKSPSSEEETLKTQQDQQIF